MPHRYLSFTRAHCSCAPTALCRECSTWCNLCEHQGYQCTQCETPSSPLSDSDDGVPDRLSDVEEKPLSPWNEVDPDLSPWEQADLQRLPPVPETPSPHTGYTGRFEELALRQTHSSSPIISAKMTSKELGSLAHALDLGDPDGLVDLCCLRTLNVATPGRMMKLLNLAKRLTSSTTSVESSTRMADIIFTLCSTSVGSSRLKMSTDFAWEHGGQARTEHALDKLIAIFCQSFERRSTPGTMLENMETSSRVISTGLLLGGLTQLETISGQEAWLCQQKTHFLRMLKSILQEITVSTRLPSNPPRIPSLESLEDNLTCLNWSQEDSQSTGIATRLSEGGYWGAYRAALKRSSPPAQVPHTPKKRKLSIDS